ncbi:MAG TPA: hypothetical protein PK675_05365 [Clostridia bacterium]|nr:hypothetical protein [Clostridia bacterium]
MNIYKMLPFLDREEIDKLVEKATDDELSVIPLKAILPFASSKTIDRLVVEEFKKTGTIKGSYCAFASSKAMHEIVLYHIENDFGTLPNSILPFLDSADVKLLFDYSLAKGDFEKPEQSDKDNIVLKFSKGKKDDSDRIFVNLSKDILKKAKLAKEDDDDDDDDDDDE